MNKKKLIEAKKVLQHKLKLIENTLDKMEQGRMEELAGISEESTDPLVGRVFYKLEDERTISGYGSVTKYYGVIKGPEETQNNTYEVVGLEKIDDKTFKVDRLSRSMYYSKEKIENLLQNSGVDATIDIDQYNKANKLDAEFKKKYPQGSVKQYQDFVKQYNK